MTNYEWIVKEDKMPTFIEAIKHNDMNLLSDMFRVPEDYHFYIADWLELEHKAIKYVPLDEVINTFKTSTFTYEFLEKLNKIDTIEVD